MARSVSGESVLTRAMRILRSFDATAASLTVSEVARRASLPVATAHRLVTELVGLGALERVAGKKVRISFQLWETVHRSSPALDLSRTAMPYMEDLQAVVQEHTQLGVLEGTEVLYLERLSARNAGRNVAEIAGRLPVHATSTGLVLLAHSSAELREEVLAGPLRRYTAHTVTDPGQLRRLLAAVRRDGHVIAPQMVSEGGVGLAAPVRGPDHLVIAALSIVVPAGGRSPYVHTPALMAAARGISRAMGAPVPGTGMIRTQGPKPFH